MNIKDSVAFVTGANRGLGLAITKALLAAGAKKVYGAARDPKSITLPGVIPIQLDVTDEAQVAAAVAVAGDVNLLINNAGISLSTPYLAADAVKNSRAEFEANYYGPLMTSRAFAPVLAENGGGAIVNVLSGLSWISRPEFATYSATKSAAWSLTNGFRNELRPQGTQVVGVHVGFMDTDMISHINAPKSNPADIAQRILDGVQNGDEEVLADEISRQVKAGFNAPRSAYLGAPLVPAAV